MAVQTNEEVMARIDEMMPGIVETIKKQAQKVLDSGCMNLADHEGKAFKPAKLILAAVLTEYAPDFMPPHPTAADKKEVKNMSRFL